ncbi:Dimeric alpha-beta barrel [Penicillium concentricum]|uniref:Dimeric alpha-beta barrel n=1 Tax=Penicillium concentricum TaxID=293559 RepID=A0A9W9VKR2_9EURO|nr:Dimeric alpha-beta barrel [Penicillium concentricum]KAJ5383141.1 Dimeric alpha-beta barrel [Penicillium concentricum]
MGVSGSTLSGRPIRMRAQRADPFDTPTSEGLLKDDFGEYTIRTEKFNDSNDWYCRHHYVRDGGVYGYHYVHLNGWYYSKNPDGSSENINPILKEAFYTLPGNKIPIDYSEKVAWERLNEIPDPCVARASVTHKLLGEFLQKLRNKEEDIITSDQNRKRATWKRRLKGKESPDMVTEDEAEETECETEKTSDEEDESQQMISEQSLTEKENETEENEERHANHLHEGIESIGEPIDAVETEGTSSQKRKANEMDESEEETARTPIAKKGSMNRRRESALTEREKKKAANRRKRERRRKANQAKQVTEKRISES